MIAMEFVKRNTDVAVPSCIQILLSIEEPMGTWLLPNQNEKKGKDVLQLFMPAMFKKQQDKFLTKRLLAGSFL